MINKFQKFNSLVFLKSGILFLLPFILLLPLLGNGPRSFPATHPRFVRKHYEELCAQYGQQVIDNYTSGMVIAYNQFLQIFTEQVLPGLGFFLVSLCTSCSPPCKREVELRSQVVSDRQLLEMCNNYRSKIFK